MTFNPKTTADVRMIHYNLSSSATITNNSKIIFNNKTESSPGTNVSFDSSGNLTLDEKCSYYMIFNPDITRGSNLESNKYIDISMYKHGSNPSYDTQMLPNDGASNVEFRGTYQEFSNLSLVVTLKNPTDTYSFRYWNSNGNSATVNTQNHLMIMEFY